MDDIITTDQAPFRASEYTNDGTYHLLLAASGSVATIKIPSILQALSRHRNLSIRLILTQSSLHFLHDPSDPSAPTPLLPSLRAIPNLKGIHLDAHEWTTPPWTRGAPILHIELRRWAHLLVIAPLSANTLAKIAHGLADNLLCSVVRAWDTTGKVDGVTGMMVVRAARKQVLVAPAMNTAMWFHPVTKAQFGVLGEWAVDGWIEVLPPQEKELACGDRGEGAMMEWTQIVKVVEDKFGLV